MLKKNSPFKSITETKVIWENWKKDCPDKREFDEKPVSQDTRMTDDTSFASNSNEVIVEAPKPREEEYGPEWKKTWDDSYVQLVFKYFQLNVKMEQNIKTRQHLSKSIESEIQRCDTIILDLE